MAHVDYQGDTPTITRRLALGNSSNVSQDSTFEELGPSASQWVDDMLKDVADSVPFSEPYPDYVVYLTSVRVATMYKLEKQNSEELMKPIRAELKSALEAARNAAKASATDRTGGPLAFGDGFETPHIEEEYWDGTTSNNGPPL